MRKVFLIIGIVCFFVSAGSSYAAGLYECRQAERTIQKQLRDPSSAQFECGQMVNSAGGNVLVMKVNAKNAYGGYSGWQTWGVVFMPDKSVEAFSPEMMKAAGFR